MTDWKTIVREHRQLVWQTVYRLVGNETDALDCSQETFLEAVKLDRREIVRDWSALLRHLATARALDLLRVRCRQRDRAGPPMDPDLVTCCQAAPHQEAEANELAARLRAALAELPAPQAEVFCLCRLEGMTYRGAAERMGLDTNGVGVLLHRACQRLQQLLVSEAVDSSKTK